LAWLLDEGMKRSRSAWEVADLVAHAEDVVVLLVGHDDGIGVVLNECGLLTQQGGEELKEALA